MRSTDRAGDFVLECANLSTLSSPKREPRESGDKSPNSINRRQWCQPQARGIIRIMNTFLLMLSIIVAASFACSTSKSAGPHPAANNSGSPQVAPPPNSESVQEKSECGLTLDAAPNIKGLKLRMTTDEVLALFPGAKNDPQISAELSRPPRQFGIGNLMVRPEKYESKAQYTEVNQITLTFLDGRVSKVHVGFNGPEWPHVDKFVAKFVEGTNLPGVDQWAAYVGLDNQLKVLACSDFELRVFAGGQGGTLNYVQMLDLKADETLKERRKKAREQASPTPGNK